MAWDFLFGGALASALEKQGLMHQLGQWFGQSGFNTFTHISGNVGFSFISDNE